MGLYDQISWHAQQFELLRFGQIVNLESRCLGRPYSSELESFNLGSSTLK